MSQNLQGLFSNNDLKLALSGGESNGISITDIVKLTTSSVTIDNKKYQGIPLSSQGTGIQRMSLIYIFQNDSNDITNMKILNCVDSYINKFFFAKDFFVVEGNTEYIAIKNYTRDKKLPIHVIRARGKGTICSLMKILNQFNTVLCYTRWITNRNT